MNPHLSPGNIAGIVASVAGGIAASHFYGPVAGVLLSIPAYFAGVLCLAFGWLAVSSMQHFVGALIDVRERRRSR